MVIGFNKKFVEPILKGVKVHTIREDKNNRWKAGMLMHMATGVRTKQYKEFAKTLCECTCGIEIEPQAKTVQLIHSIKESEFLGDNGIKTLAKNDGFNSVEDFWKWFNKPFVGKLIYWKRNSIKKTN
ncbi:hypothetical protein [Aurantibacillus circumpalustris]|uniref:hypothetical protein n=1 Tax=Aurantibacillus circumpalustris TaxID=3036359 RepID=UPI00295B1F55|nr:hypothetical protein [Aurantibacillus circumpalustris]